MGVFSRIFNKPAQISLVREDQSFYLLAYYDEELSPIATVAEKWPELQELTRRVQDRNALRNTVPISGFAEMYAYICGLKEQLSGNTRISFYIPAEIEAVQILSSAPDWFVVSYHRQGNALERLLPESVIELEDGWLRHQNTYWRYEKLDEDATLGFRRTSIPIENWVNFVKSDLPVYRAAGINITSWIEYDAHVALQLEVQKYAEETAEIRVVWEVQPETIDESICLEEHVLSMNRIQPGLRPSVVKIVFPNEVNILSSMQLASFLDREYPALKKWFSTIPPEFEGMQSWIEPPYTWELCARSKLTRGVGKAYAHPVACIGGNRLSIEDLKAALRNPYARLQGGWVRKEDLLTLGMNEHGYRPDGTEVKPIRLDASLLLHNGGNRLGPYWSAMECEGTEWVDRGDKHTCARKHLGYLLHWGINGGLSCGYEGMTAYGISLLSWIGRREKGCKILLLGSKEDVRELRGAHPYIESMMREQDFQWIDYETASRNEELKRKRWDLLLMIEPDAYASEKDKSIIQSAAATSAACKIGFFAKMPQSDPELRRWIAGLLGYGAEPELLDYLVRDGRNPRSLPEKYVFHAGEIKKAQSVLKSRNEPAVMRPLENGGAEVILPGKDDEGTRIPPRPEPPLGPEFARYLHPTMESLKKGFFDEARELVQYTEDTAEHTPFFCYWPQYSEMDESQRKWYFYLRGRIRRDEYPETDPSYLFVYVYEILNLIGVQNATEGYRKLLKIQSMYGEQHPSLRNHLNIWIYDYVHVYDCGIAIEQLLSDLPQLPEQGLNELLLKMSEGDAFNLPLWALERLSGYKITNSKFYQRNNQELMNSCIPGALCEIDWQLRKKGKGLLDTYAALKIHNDNFMAFGSALVETQRTYTIRSRHYQNGLKLRSYLKNAIRYAENALRAQQKYSARLQGVELDERSRAWIDAYIAALPKKKENLASEKKATAKINLDLEKLNQLRSDSDEVRDALIASVSDPGTEESFAVEIERPEGCADDLLTDLAPVQGILTRLSSEQRRVLDCMALHAWKVEISALHRELTGLVPEVLAEEINEVSMVYLGCFLIEREDEEFVVAEDYRDELEYLMPRQEKNAGDWKVDLDGLDEEWAAFFAQAELTVLGQLLEGWSALIDYARGRGEMPELLLDELNNVSSDTIGDLIADENGIIDDYLPVIQKHLRKG